MTKQKTIEEYHKLLRNLLDCSADQKASLLRYLCRTDLFFLLWYGCGRKDVARPWLMDRCFEIQNAPNGYLDLWSREHYKSTIITFAKTIQDILASHGDDPLACWNGIEPTFGIFSCTRPLAKGFLRQIKLELERNVVLKDLFPDVIWENPSKDAPKWSEDDGLILIRKSNPKEATIEAWGIVEGQPTSKHFFGRIYDDLITDKYCTTPDMIEKTTRSWELSINLGMDGGFARYIGTRYHFNDTYRTMMERGAAIPRIYPATVGGEIDGEPVLLSREALDEKRRIMGSYTFSCQMLLNPVADENQGFIEKNLRFYEFHSGEGLNKYILVDPANEKKRSSDYSVFWVIGLGYDENYRVLDIVRDRLNLRERGDTLFRLHRKWRPLNTGYESYGMVSDISYIEEKMNRENYHFNITPLRGNVSKNDRIKALGPLFEQNRIYLPNSLLYTDYEGKTKDLVNIFIQEEYKCFPVSVHDDMLDAMARILDKDLGAVWPMIPEEESKKDRYTKNDYLTNYSSWGV